MKKLSGIYLAAALIMILSLIAGCGSKITTTDSEGRKVTLDTSKKEIAVEGKDGKTLVKTEDKDGKVNIDVKGPDGEVKITGDGEKGHIKVDGPGGKVTIDTGDGGKTVTVDGDKGKLKAGEMTDVKESDFPVKFYPGAVVEKGHKMNMEDEEGQKTDAKTVRLLTSDEPEKVRDFYKGQLEGAIVTETDDGIAIVKAPEEGGNVVTVTIPKEKEDDKTQIIISEVNN